VESATGHALNLESKNEDAQPEIRAASPLIVVLARL